MNTQSSSAVVRRSALIAALCGLVGQAAASTTSEPLAMSGQNLDLAAPSARIYRSVARDGSVVFGDQPQAGATSMQVRTYASSSAPDALARADREREYWRKRAEGFAQRHRERERDLEETRRLNILSAQRNAYAAAPRVPIYLRSPYWGQGAPRPPQVPPSALVPAYPTMPGISSGVPSNFIGSGFSTAR
ncbi:MAG TPA: DUF4124 domain-containing protein [Quisquiliibacterium sp.]|nr:DUF4124 domain-containing protein [Quisquiliibacterium sp.]